MFMKQLLLMAFGLFLAINLNAQRSVSGMVTGEDGDPLIGATVLVKGTTAGTVTDLSGKYTVNVPEGGTVLVVSFVGYATEEVQIGSQSTIDVVLKTGEVLGEVLVTGSRGARRHAGLDH